MRKMAYLFSILALMACVAGSAPMTTEAGSSSAKITVDGSTTVGPIAKAFAEYYMRKNPGVEVSVSESGSGNGAKGIINGTCDVADMSRFMKENEFKAAVEGGVTPVAHVVAMDGLPILVHPANPVGGLTVEQVRDIFSGKIKNWKEVGGPDLKIVKVSRDTNSGTYETFEELVMKGGLISQDTEYVGSNGAVRQRVQSTPASIGYAGLGFVDDTVKALEINETYPDQDTVSSGMYPIARPLFMFTNGYPKLGSPLHQFVTIYLSPEGQEIIEEIGFVPLTKY
jgi:phosphate transport system substrate-binding protein